MGASCRDGIEGYNPAEAIFLGFGIEHEKELRENLKFGAFSGLLDGSDTAHERFVRSKGVFGLLSQFGGQTNAENEEISTSWLRREELISQVLR
jgi:hypothetical protein